MGDRLQMMSVLVYPAAVALSVSFGISVLLVLSQRWHATRTADHSGGVQKFHVEPTPRIGGLAVAVGLIAAWPTFTGEMGELSASMMAASIPALAFGTAEDLSNQISPMTRLLATLSSGVLAWWITGISLTHSGLWGVDQALAWGPISVAFTALAVAGVANAVNMVDGFNGLASGLVIISLMALAAMAQIEQDSTVMSLCLLLAAATLGFMVMNFPFGKIFLGDGGAYFLGFCLAWLAILLLQRHTDISAMAVLLSCCYPVIEALYSIWRRIHRHTNPMLPDRLHLHSLVKRRIARKKLPHWPQVMRNSSVSPLIWLMASVPAMLGVLMRETTWAAAAALLLCVCSYVMIYRRLVRFGRWR